MLVLPLIVQFFVSCKDFFPNKIAGACSRQTAMTSHWLLLIIKHNLPVCVFCESGPDNLGGLYVFTHSHKSVRNWLLRWKNSSKETGSNSRDWVINQQTSTARFISDPTARKEGKWRCNDEISVGLSGSRRSQLTRLEPGSLRAADSSQLGRVRLATHRKPRPFKILSALQTPPLAKIFDFPIIKKRRGTYIRFVSREGQPVGGTPPNSTGQIAVHCELMKKTKEQLSVTCQVKHKFEVAPSLVNLCICTAQH